MDDSTGVTQWVLERLPEIRDLGFGPATAIGVCDKHNVPLMGIVFHSYLPQWSIMQLSMAADSPRWAHRSVIARILAYPFVTLGVNRLWAAHQHTNARAERLSKGLGFVREATLAHHFGQGKHAVVTRMLKKDFDRLYGAKLAKECPD